MKDKRAFLFYFLMTIIFLDFGNQIKILSLKPEFINISNSVFSIMHVNNTGSAFSLFQNQANILALVGIIAILYLIYYVYTEIKFSDKTELLSITLFSAGTLGNLIERLNNGYVLDYIKLNFIDFPVFNAFDIMICTGVLLYITCVILNTKRDKKLENNSCEQ